jgi:predicted RNA-binding protein with PIN domain
MKLSGREDKRSRHKKCLIVDGYNIIGRMHGAALRDIHDIEEVRERLVEQLAEFSSYSGEKVIVVFDAHHSKNPERDEDYKHVRVIYTSVQETADDRIERLVYELRDHYREITVATSDFAEQQVIFGGGALRISANELVNKIKHSKERIRTDLSERHDVKRNKVGDLIRQDIANILEKWRRE